MLAAAELDTLIELRGDGRVGRQEADRLTFQEGGENDDPIL
jgi:hypothetical protein